MRIDSIRVCHFSNIEDVRLDLRNITSLVAPNNYGKTNVLAAVRFAVDFMEGTSREKETLINMRSVTPINTAIIGKPFVFEVKGGVRSGRQMMDFFYTFSFQWGKGIVAEMLGLKQNGDKKYRTYIQRSSANKAFYLQSQAGRCTKELALSGQMLALNKLINFDDLFYVDLLRKVSALDLKVVDTLKSPETYFLMSSPSGNTQAYSTAFPESEQTAFFIYSLRKKAPDRYALLCDAVKQLLPNVEDMEAVEIKLDQGKGSMGLNDLLFDIRIKEKHNNGYTSISRVSSGSKKILYVLALTMAAEMNALPLITFEELENSVHPRLLQNLLLTVSTLAGDTKVLTTSHSPYLIKYLSPEQIYLGLPSDKGVADFKTIKPSKVKKVLRLASSEEVSMGEYLFEMMLDLEGDETMRKEYFQ